MSRKEREAYELEYWTKNGLKKGKKYFDNLHSERLVVFNTLHKLPFVPKVALELGPGPFEGMSSVYKVGKWYLLDPLNDVYLTMVNRDTNKVYLQAYCESIPLDDKSVDIMFSCNSLDHADDYHMCIDEAFRVLKNEGLFYLTVDCRTKAQLNIGHRHSFSVNEIEKEFVSKGFKSISKAEGTRESKSYLNIMIVFKK